MHTGFLKQPVSVACPKCASEFTSIGNMNRHVRLSHAEQPPRVACDMCEKTFNCKGGLNRHKRQRHSARSPLVTCPECTSVFASRGNLNRHHLGQSARVPCNQFEKTFNCREGLNRQKQQRHSNQSQIVTCSHCGSQFTGRGNLNRHIRMSHTEHLWNKATISDTEHAPHKEIWTSNPLPPTKRFNQSELPL